jgi:hypothetical protein
VHARRLDACPVPAMRAIVRPPAALVASTFDSAPESGAQTCTHPQAIG